MILLALGALIVNGCSENGFTKTKSGLKYQYVTNGDGPAPQNGEVVFLNISYTDANNNVLFNSGSENNEPMPMSYVDSMFVRDGGIEEGIRMLHEGDSILLKFPIEDLFENTFNMDLPDTLERGSDVTVCIGFKNIMTMDEFNVYARNERLKRAEAAANAEETQYKTDSALINDYLETENIEAEEHESGLMYQVVEKGNGPIPQAGQQVSVNYTGRLLDGTIFDTSYPDIAKEEGIFNEQRSYAPYTFQLGRGAVIRGWDIGIGLINEGTKAKLFIPSKLGYGPRAFASIPANSVLVFDVELVNVE